MKVRKAVVGDLKRVYELSKIKELYTAAGDVIPLHYFENVIGPETVFLVAEEEDKIVGYSIANILPGKLALWQLLAVDPAFQSKGIGKILANKIKEECLERGLDWITGYVSKSNEKALRFHKSLGFEIGEDMVGIIKELKR